MYHNPSSALTAMKTALAAIQQIQVLLESESHNLSPEAYEQIKEYLSTVEYGLKQEIGGYQKSQFVEPPHLHDDDGTNASLIQQFTKWVSRR